MINTKIKKYINATHKIKKQEIEQIKLSHEKYKEIKETMRRTDVKLVIIEAISDTSDDGHYQLIDSKGNILYEILITPYTIRILENNKTIARCYVQVTRSELEDEITFPDTEIYNLMSDIYWSSQDQQKKSQQIYQQKGFQK